MSDHGYHALGKFSSARDDLLHFMVTSDWANESTGNSVDWEGYAWRISNTPEDVSVNNGEFNSLIEDWFKSNPEVTDSGFLRAELVGNFLVTEVSSGIVYVESFETPEALQKAYNAFDARYQRWAGEEYGDGEEL